ncbi:MAG TPA: hypothetical protein VLE23_10085 [Geminicoccaceae bacterium]|nr:hypothetical protein [Geminicoccaceae bacterium]
MSGSALAQQEWRSSPAFPGKRARENAPPVIAWLWAVAFAAVAVAVFLYVAGKVEIPESQAFLEFNQRRADEFAAAPQSDELRVVMLGNSRLKYATLDDAQLANLAADLGYGRMRFLRLVNNWAVFGDFAPLVDAIVAARPHVIVMQLELLAQERAERARVLLLREYVEWLMFGRGSWNPGDIDQTDLQYGTPCAMDPAAETLEERKRRVRRWLLVQPDGPSSRQARAFVAQVAAQETAVMLLALPRTSTMETAARSVSGEMRAVAERLIPLHPAVRLVEPAGPADQLYCDLVHMAEPARGAFSAELLGALARGGGRSLAVR